MKGDWEVMGRRKCVWVEDKLCFRFYIFKVWKVYRDFKYEVKKINKNNYGKVKKDISYRVLYLKRLVIIWLFLINVRVCILIIGWKGIN